MNSVHLLFRKLSPDSPYSIELIIPPEKLGRRASRGPNKESRSKVAGGIQNLRTIQRSETREIRATRERDRGSQIRFGTRKHYVIKRDCSAGKVRL